MYDGSSYSSPLQHLILSVVLILAIYCFCSVTELCLTLCNPVDCSLPGFLVLYHLPEVVQTHVLWISDAIQPSHPLLPPSPLALNLSQHQGLFQLVGSLHQVPKVLEIQFFQWTFRITSEYIVISHGGCNLHLSNQWPFLYIFTHAYLPFLYLLWLSLQIFHSF